MAETESLVATVAAEPAINMKPANIEIDWAPEVEPTPVVVEPASPPPEPDASAEEPLAPAVETPRDWAALTADLSKEEMDRLVKESPALKRRLDGELGSRLQAREAAIRKEASERTLAEYNSEVALVNTSIDEYDKIEALQETNPDEYAEKWASNTGYKKWVADLFDRRDKVVAKSQVKTVGQPSGQDATAALAQFHQLAIPEAIDTLRAEAGDMYAALPAEARKAIESASYNPDESWLQVILKNFAQGAKAASERSMKAAVAAAREAGRKEALSESEGDRPVVATNTSTSKLTANQIIQEHAFNGFANITREQLAAAKAEKGY